MIHFDLPKDKSSIIKVIGVGGGGSNAVNHMLAEGIDGVNFVICNTDAQAITTSKVPNKVQLGPTLTQGLGAGANPTVGKEATEESLEEIKQILEVNTKMAFITAGMGGGTGTGGAPIVAKICKELDILTVGIVTTPFGYEGKKRMEQARLGIEALKQNVDTLLVINNDKLRHKYGNLKMSEAFAKADNILATAAKCIVDVINVTGQINVDFADVCTVMRNGGVAILGNSALAGENRAQEAVEEALNSPLLNDNDITGAKWILLNITSAEGEFEHTMDEVEIINQYIVEHAGSGVDIIMGQGFDNSLGDKIAITLIATGFESKDNYAANPNEVSTPQPQKIVMPLQPTVQQVATTQTEPVATVPTVTTSTVEPIAAVPEFKLTTTEIPTKQINIFQQPSNELPITAPNVEVEKTVVGLNANVENTNTLNTESNGSGFLAKPTNIYQQPNVFSAAKVEEVKEDTPNDNTMVWDFSSEQTLAPLELVIKEETPLQNEPTPMPIVEDLFNNSKEVETQIVPNANFSNDELSNGAERTKKLRSLSFNYNNADSDELENVPAYLRRQNEINPTLAKVEKFYSDYTVHVDDNNQAQINMNSANSFLEGERPD
jgi:cell division protein FtsZ